jgi:hypothetical protein
VAARHIYRGPCLVDEDQAFGIEIELILEASPAPLQVVRAFPLAGVRRLSSVIRWRSKNAKGRRCWRGCHSLQLGFDLGECDALTSRTISKMVALRI